MHSSIPILEFNGQGDIDFVDSTKQTRVNCQCLLARYIFQQFSLSIFVCIYLIVGGFLFSYIESQYYLKQDIERKELISETYANIRSLAVQLLNEQLNDDFESAYQQWRWRHQHSQSNYILLNSQRASALDNRTEVELESLSIRLEMRKVARDKLVYKWTYPTAILYAATLVTTIGYGNISPKTALGKICTVIYALFGILLMISWLKFIGDSLANLVTKYYLCLEKCFQRHKKQYRNQILFHNRKVPFYVPITLLILYLLAGSLLFSIWEGWPYIDGAYFSFITFTTIGFGDLVPGETTISQRSFRSILCATYLLFGVMLTAMAFKLIQEDIDRMKICLFQRLGIEHVHLPTIKR